MRSGSSRSGSGVPAAEEPASGGAAVAAAAAARPNGSASSVQRPQRLQRRGAWGGRWGLPAPSAAPACPWGVLPPSRQSHCLHPLTSWLLLTARRRLLLSICRQQRRQQHRHQRQLTLHLLLHSAQRALQWSLQPQQLSWPQRLPVTLRLPQQHNLHHQPQSPRRQQQIPRQQESLHQQQQQRGLQQQSLQRLL